MLASIEVKEEDIEFGKFDIEGSSHGNVILEDIMVGLVMPRQKEMWAIYELPLMNDKVCENSYQSSFGLNGIMLETEQCDNRFCIDDHGRILKFRSIRLWYFDLRIYYGTCVWMGSGKCLFALET